MNKPAGVRIVLVYDPVHGEPTSDGLAYAFVYSIVNSTAERIVYTSTSLVVEYFRLAVFREDLLSSELIIRFNDETILVESDGRFNKYPRGFLDQVENIMMEIL